MKSSFLSGLAAAAVSLVAVGGCVSHPVIEPQANVSFNVSEIVSATEVEKMIKEKPGSYVLLDARSDEYFDGNVIPTAKRLSCEASDSAVRDALPDTSAKIVTYCGGVRCPASRKLAERLRAMGYKDVKEFPDGIKGWRELGKRVEKLPAR